MRLATFRNVFFTLLLIICISNDGSCQQFPHQVQQFFQSYIVKPLEEVNKKAEEITGAITQLINPSSLSPSNSSSGNTNDTLSPPQLSDDISLAINASESLPTIKPNNTVIQSSLSNSNKEENPTTLENDSTTKSTTVSNQETSTAHQPSSAAYFRSPNVGSTLSSEQVQTLKGLCPDLAVRPDEDVQANWRYFEPQNQCFRLDRRGPCGQGMILNSQGVESIYSYCGCVPFNSKDSRMMIYDNETNSCYPIFTKGNCKEDEWIDLTRSGEPICTTNPCAKNGTDYVWYKDTCVEVGKTHEYCEDNKVITFRYLRRSPGCFIAQQTVQTGPAPCPPGSYQAIHGKCHVANWEFGDEDE